MAVKGGCRLEKACDEVEISLRTYRRWYHSGEVRADRRPDAIRPAPANKLTEEERQAVIATCNAPAYAELPPSQIVPGLLDKGIYIASESSYYRILKACGQLHHHGRSRAPAPSQRSRCHTATDANDVWMWDITYCASVVKGVFYYLYLIEDLYSRKIVGYEVHEKECGHLAALLVQRTLLREQCLFKPLVLHSDNGAAMKSQTLKAKLEELNVLPSYNRPGVSNDNAYAESLFRTLKYRPQWPCSGFKSLADARKWVDDFTRWYNDEHKHSRIQFVTPSERHAGQDKMILMHRRQVLEAAKQANPARWSGDVRNCSPIEAVTLNPGGKTGDKNAA